MMGIWLTNGGGNTGEKMGLKVIGQGKVNRGEGGSIGKGGRKQSFILTLIPMGCYASYFVFRG